MAEVLLELGQFEEAARLVMRLREQVPDEPRTLYLTAKLASLRTGDLAPLREALVRSPNTQGLGLWPRILADAPDEALAAAKRITRSAPQVRAQIEAAAHFVLGDRERMRAACTVALEAVEATRGQWVALGGERGVHVALTEVYSCLGRLDDAAQERRLAQQMARTPAEKRTVWWFEARVAMLAGQTDAAFAALDQALAEKRSFTVAYLKNSRFYAPLRSDPRFAALLAKHSR